MGRTKTVLIGIGGLVGVSALAVAGGALWAVSTANAKLAVKPEVHALDFPAPLPLTAEEIEALRAEKVAELAAAAPEGAPEQATDAVPAEPVDVLAGVDLDAIARERAVARGKHLIEARYACVECHGADLGGGTMIDSPVFGVFKGPNLTLGQGSATAAYTMADWDRIVRHGVKKDGTTAVMPSEDFLAMSDQELADLVTYIRTLPPVDREMPPVAPGPLAYTLLAAGAFQLSAEKIDHAKPHPTRPPAEGATAEYGKHLMQVCTGCHRAELNGGPMAGGDPAWKTPANLTPHEQGLAAYTFEDFERLMRTGKRPDGTEVGVPMTIVIPYSANMTELELQAAWAYLQSIPALPTGT